MSITTDNPTPTTTTPKSYYSQAILALMFYAFLYVPGLCMSAYFFGEAWRLQQATGRKVPGIGCLIADIVFGFVALMVICVAFFVWSFLRASRGG